MAAMTMLGGGLGKLHAATSTITDADIVNFALNLEYLEAEFYSVATRGHTLVERDHARLRLRLLQLEATLFLTLRHHP